MLEKGNFTPKCSRQEKVFSIVAYRHDCWCLFKALFSRDFWILNKLSQFFGCSFSNKSQRIHIKIHYLIKGRFTFSIISLFNGVNLLEVFFAVMTHGSHSLDWACFCHYYTSQLWRTCVWEFSAPLYNQLVESANLNKFVEIYIFGENLIRLKNKTLWIKF